MWAGRMPDEAHVPHVAFWIAIWGNESVVQYSMGLTAARDNGSKLHAGP
jgi:hypothetical protein